MTTADGFTALHLAVTHGQLEVMKLLLQHGASLHARTTEQIYQPVWASSGATPLHLAAARASRQLCMALLQAYVSCCTGTQVCSHSARLPCPVGSFMHQLTQLSAPAGVMMACIAYQRPLSVTDTA